uniref:Uncharacterized protein n=1 Tax=Panagrolaimus superbus TaxID=310955 RepID=A0A914Z9G8_9BILA
MVAALQLTEELEADLLDDDVDNVDGAVAFMNEFNEVFPGSSRSTTPRRATTSSPDSVMRPPIRDRNLLFTPIGLGQEGNTTYLNRPQETTLQEHDFDHANFDDINDINTSSTEVLPHESEVVNTASTEVRPPPPHETPIPATPEVPSQTHVEALSQCVQVKHRKFQDAMPDCNSERDAFLSHLRAFNAEYDETLERVHGPTRAEQNAFQCTHKLGNKQKCNKWFHKRCRNRRINAWVQFWQPDAPSSPSQPPVMSQSSGRSRTRSRTRTVTRNQVAPTIDTTWMANVCYEHAIPIALHSLKAPVQTFFRAQFNREYYFTGGAQDLSNVDPREESYRQ